MSQISCLVTFTYIFYLTLKLLPRETSNVIHVYFYTLIIRMIKTTCFSNTILMVRLERKIPSALNFPGSSYFHKIFGMHLQKGLVYHYTKMFLLSLLHFWNYSLSPNGQIISFTGAQAHLQTKLLRAEWYKVLKIIHAEYL